MFIWGIITSVFWAIVIAIVLWALCAFAGRLVNSSYRMHVLLHLFCIAVAVPTVIFLFIFITCTKLNNYVTEVKTGVTKLMLNDGNITNHLTDQIAQTSTEVSIDKLTDFLADNFSNKIASEYPMLSKYANIDKWVEKVDLSDEFLMDLSDTEKQQKIVQKTVSFFTDGIQSKIKSTRRKAFITVFLLQAVAFGIVLYKAGRYRSPISKQFNYLNGSTDYL